MFNETNVEPSVRIISAGMWKEESVFYLSPALPEFTGWAEINNGTLRYVGQSLGRRLKVRPPTCGDVRCAGCNNNRIEKVT